METLEDTELCFPQLLNASCRKTKRHPSSVLLVYILLCSVSLLTLTLNLLVIISISHYKQLHTKTNLLLLSLAVSDFLVGFLMLLQIILLNGCWLFGDIMCALYYVSDYIITGASVGNMVLISIDRFVAICDPLHYPTIITKTKVKVSICACWSCSAFFYCVQFRESLMQPGKYNSCSGECVVVIDYVSGMIDVFVAFVGPVTVVIVLYMRVFVVAVSQANAMRFSTVPSLLQSSAVVRVTVKKSEMKAAGTLGIVVIVFLGCVCPYFCIVLSNQNTLLNPSSETVIIFLFYFNSCLNPMIYALFYPWFRKCIKLIITLKILVPDSRYANML